MCVFLCGYVFILLFVCLFVRMLPLPLPVSFFLFNVVVIVGFYVTSAADDRILRTRQNYHLQYFNVRGIQIPTTGTVYTVFTLTVPASHSICPRGVGGAGGT